MHDLVLAIPLIIQLLIASSSGAASRRAMWFMIASYLAPPVMGDVVAAMDRHGVIGHLAPILGTDPSQRIWLLTHEYLFLSLLLAYLSAYFFTIDAGDRIENANGYSLC